jgi:hypothetical protein
VKTHKPLRQRFLEKITVDEQTGCWLWTGRIDPNGYARFQRGVGLSPLAHRYSYEEFVGPIPDEMELDHVRAHGCVHRHCVNHAHLEPVTRLENVVRGDSFAAVNARKTTCDNGHPFAGRNVKNITRPDGRRERVCLECKRARNRAYKRRLREAVA